MRLVLRFLPGLAIALLLIIIDSPTVWIWLIVLLGLLSLLYLGAPHITSWKLDLREANDPLSAVLNRRGGGFLSEQHLPLMILHFLWLDVFKETFIEHSEFIKRRGRVSIRIEYLNSDLFDAGVISPAKNRYLIFITKGLYFTLYDTFAKLVRDEEFLPNFGLSDAWGNISAERRETFKVAVDDVAQNFPWFEDRPGRAALLIVLVHFALAFVFFHEFAHIDSRDVEAYPLAERKFGLAENPSDKGLPEFSSGGYGNLLVRHRSELNADVFATDFGLSSARDFKPSDAGQLVPLLLREIAFNATDREIRDCWFLAICTLFVLLGLTDKADISTSSHPFAAIRFKRVVQRIQSEELAAEHQWQRDWRAIFRTACEWCSKLDIPVEDLLASIGDSRLSDLSRELEEAILAKSQADVFVAQQFIEAFSPKWSRDRLPLIVKALRDLHVYLLNIPGNTAADVMKNQHYEAMKKTEAYISLESWWRKEVTGVLAQRPVLDKLMTISDWRYQLRWVSA